ncbi:hypothetical protein ABZX40_15130 [Streptomyces sp. NPDC004610]|uniref:hypothetical protein n=1 Tax=unclassified Streptomyces TaxID=2593676 RepID=UPI0033B35317
MGDPLEIVYNPAALRDVRNAEQFNADQRFPLNPLMVPGAVFLAFAVVLAVYDGWI